MSFSSSQSYLKLLIMYRSSIGLRPFEKDNWYKAEDGRYYPYIDDGCYALLVLIYEGIGWLNRKIFK